jgi:hypothetical protein
LVGFNNNNNFKFTYNDKNNKINKKKIGKSKPSAIFYDENGNNKTTSWVIRC